jgi:hypothetical protein
MNAIRVLIVAAALAATGEALAQQTGANSPDLTRLAKAAGPTVSGPIVQRRHIVMIEAKQQKFGTIHTFLLLNGVLSERDPWARLIQHLLVFEGNGKPPPAPRRPASPLPERPYGWPFEYIDGAPAEWPFRPWDLIWDHPPPPVTIRDPREGEIQVPPAPSATRTILLVSNAQVRVQPAADHLGGKLQVSFVVETRDAGPQKVRTFEGSFRPAENGRQLDLYSYQYRDGRSIPSGCRFVNKPADPVTRAALDAYLGSLIPTAAGKNDVLIRIPCRHAILPGSGQGHGRPIQDQRPADGARGRE